MSYKEDLENNRDRNNKPVMVLIHGFGATGLMFYKLIDLLRREYRLTTIDLLGMGGSGRPKFDLKTSRDCISFFVYSIEAYMRRLDNIKFLKENKKINEKIILMGHSLGAFLSVHYALQFPERVNQLILASPVGLPE